MDKPRVMGCTLMVPTGGSAVMTIALPGADPHLEWSLRYGNPKAVRFMAASVVESFDYLLSDSINLTEATRRLRVLRAAVRAQLAVPAVQGVTACQRCAPRDSLSRTASTGRFDSSQRPSALKGSSCE